MSRFWLDKKKVQILQVLLVLSLISPLNDPIVVMVEMALKFEKWVEPMNMLTMALPVMKFQDQGYEIRKVFA